MELTRIDPELESTFAAFLPQSLLAGIGSGELAALGVTLLGIPAGAVVMQTEAYAVRLLSIVVDPCLRRHGIGRFLLDGVSDCVRSVGGIFTLRACLPVGDMCAKGFFDSAGWRLHEREEGVDFHFPLSALDGSPLLARPGERSIEGGACLPGTDVSPEMLAHFERRLRGSGTFLCERSLADPAVDQSLSQYFVRGGEVRGCVVYSPEPGGLHFDFAYVEDEGGIFQRLLSISLAAVRRRLSPEAVVTLDAVNPAARNLVERLVPGAVKTRRLLAEYSL